MAIYSSKLSEEWVKAFEKYEQICGFEPMYQEEIDNGEMTPREAWNANIEWLEDVFATCINIHTPDE